MARIAFIVAEDFEDSELKVPYDRLIQAGHQVVLVGVQASQRLTGKRGTHVTTDRAIEGLSANDFDALVIPGGYSPDKLRTHQAMVGFTRDFNRTSKPIAAICHAGSMLVEANVVGDRTVTSWPSIKTDLLNAGANWVDREVVEDGNLITSRNPDDLPAFCDALLRQLGQRASPAPPQGNGATGTTVH
jgi:protease I